MEADSWHILKKFTHARIANGHAGSALPTREVLHFRMSHALARDAVYSSLDVDQLSRSLSNSGMPSITLHSQAQDRSDYLLNPNKGRVLDKDSIEKLQSEGALEVDLCIIIADGLSASAVNLHALNVIELLKVHLPSWQLATVVLVKQARVAISDTIGELIRAKIALILIGERPGLSSPSSMGAYITYQPKSGNTDEKRNCISNIQPEGLSYEFAASKIAYMLNQMRMQQLSGVKLKDDFDGSLMQLGEQAKMVL
ncbi:MAG: ethanolamine ammonia-lyase subunit EutC [Bacteroidales bacterium]|nr:ethanolamine ammonia-lyase subunit EutC [Bacteroidales bacterium]